MRLDLYNLVPFSVGRIAIINETVMVLESIGLLRIYIGFVEPEQISPSITANITFSTQDNTAEGRLDILACLSSQNKPIFLCSWQ